MTTPLAVGTPDELFDVVNERDEVVGQAMRRDVHARNLLHRAIHVLIHNAKGEFFIQHRSLRKDKFPGCWDSSCSGHVDAGEDYLTAAHRELGEELGYRNRARPLRPLLKLEASPETGYEFIQIFLLGPTQGPFVLQPEEISEGRWITAAELDRWLDAAPEELAGALRHLWRCHRDTVVAGMKS